MDMLECMYGRFVVLFSMRVMIGIPILAVLAILILLAQDGYVRRQFKLWLVLPLLLAAFREDSLLLDVEALHNC